MIRNFWTELKKPILMLAPMADVTDPAYRRIIATLGKPDVMFTEFVSCDGLCHPDAKERILKDILYSELERPIVLQIFSSKPENVYKCGMLAKELGFDGIDINMGCPDRSVMKQGCGAELIKNPNLAQKIIEKAKEGSQGLPVSVKTRTGYNEDELDTWLPEILRANPSAVTIHLRTKKEMSKIPAHWARARRAVEIRNEVESKALIIGNGDVLDMDDAREKIKETGVDGVMLGRAIFGNPWLFSKAKRENLSIKVVLNVLITHVRLFHELEGKYRSFSLMKKHFKSYIESFPGAKELRRSLMEAKDVEEFENMVNTYIRSLPS